MRILSLPLAGIACTALAASSLAQSNTVAGRDVELGFVESMSYQGRIGPGFPNGTVAFSMSTTSCNPGTVTAPWFAAMQEDHPFIAFMAVREDPGDARLVQISDWSWVKHGFFALSSNQCGYGCSGTNGTALGVGCSDTYGVGNNNNRFDLGPPEEIDPWLGDWTAFGSFFDCPTGTGCNGGRSYFGAAANAVEHRVVIQESDLNVANSDYYYYSYYVVQGEAEGNRVNNGASRKFNPNFNGSSWSSPTSGSKLNGTPLQRWNGATINSNTNSGDDGRVYVAYKVSGGGGNWHYEYAVHNRDNNRGVGEFRFPLIAGASVSNFGFHDVDQDNGNQWTGSVVGNEIVFTTNNNPVRWNTIYNFWFDADAPPAATSASIVQFDGGPGAGSFLVDIEGPSIPVPPDFTDVCSGDGGDQAGCTNCPCGNNAPPGTIGGCLNNANAAGRLNWSGAPQVSSDTMRFTVSQGAPSSFGVLTSGAALAPANAANPCFGLNSGVTAIQLDGLRCAVQGVLRHGARALNAFGFTSTGWGPPDGPAGGLIANGGFTAGQVRHFQVIYRQPPATVCGTEQNTTQAVTVNIAP